MHFCFFGALPFTISRQFFLSYDPQTELYTYRTTEIEWKKDRMKKRKRKREKVKCSVSLAGANMKNVCVHFNEFYYCFEMYLLRYLMFKNLIKKNLDQNLPQKTHTHHVRRVMSSFTLLAKFIHSFSHVIRYDFQRNSMA